MLCCWPQKKTKTHFSTMNVHFRQSLRSLQHNKLVTCVERNRITLVNLKTFFCFPLPDPLELELGGFTQYQLQKIYVLRPGIDDYAFNLPASTTSLSVLHMFDRHSLSPIICLLWKRVFSRWICALSFLHFWCHSFFLFFQRKKRDFRY